MATLFLVHKLNDTPFGEKVFRAIREHEIFALKATVPISETGAFVWFVLTRAA